MKISVVCGRGLGNSLMVEVNAQEVLRQLDAPSSIEAEYSGIMTVDPEMADLFICGRDLAENAERLGDVLALDNILGKAEL